MSNVHYIHHISPSQIHDWMACRRKWWFNRNYRAAQPDWSLGFGGALHEAFHQFLIGLIYQFQVDATKVFDQAYKARVGKNASFPAYLDWDSARDMGMRMIEEFIEGWIQSRMKVAFFNGKPMLEVGHSVMLSERIILRGKWDCLAIKPDGRLVVLDFKSARTFTQEWFAKVSPQLSAYIILIEHYLRRRIDQAGFMEMKKNKKQGAKPHLSIVDRHPDKQLDALVEQVHWMVEDIDRGRFPAEYGMAFNTPCNLCDFQAACHDDKFDFLVRKKQFKKAA